MKSAVCLIVRNEARDIAEWISYQAAIGFDTIIVFDHGSNDGTRAILEAAQRHFDVRIHDWPDSSPRSQPNAYNAALASYRDEFEWIAFFDADEFLVIADGRPVKRFLAAYDDWAGVVIPWAIYGSNGHEEFPGGLVIENFTHRAKPNFYPVRHAKCLVRPRLTRGCPNTHCFDVLDHRAGGLCTPDGQLVQWWTSPQDGKLRPGVLAEAPDYRIAQLNHYFVRSRAHWQAKLQRGYQSDVIVRKLEQFEEYDRNEIADPIANRYAAIVREGVVRILGSL